MGQSDSRSAARDRLLIRQFPFLSILILLSVSFIFLRLQFNKEDLHLWLNSLTQTRWDTAFMWLTKIGEGWQFGIAFFILLFISFRDAAAVVVCALGVLFISAALKNLVFPDALRPTAYLEGYDLRLIPGLKMHSRHSFPSGHTMATFGSLVFFAFYFRSSVLNWFLAILALFTALSRVYLSQHFMADIVAGAWIGSLIASISYSWSRTWTSTFWSKKIGKGGRSS